MYRLDYATENSQKDVRLFSWASILEDKARAQILETAQMPFIWPHCAGMPDMHWGLGCAVGLVVPTLGAVIPACVGVDIGCGMIASRTELRYEEVSGRGDLIQLRRLVEAHIPMSKGNYNAQDFDPETRKRINQLLAKYGAWDADRADPAWTKQLGSLGGGNHFIEFCRDEEGYVWIFLHSGSRGIGNKLARKYIKLAHELCDRYWIKLPNPDLAYLVEGTVEFWDYMRCLRWAQEFAALNREEMMYRCHHALREWFGSEISITEQIRCHHNYTEEMPEELARSFRGDRKGRTIWLTRKGAIDASLDKPGLIPGSMGAKSYVVRGKGNKLALWSAPHGAGRNFGRRAAESFFSEDSLVQSMCGIEWSSEIAGKLRDEHPLAYKDIDNVMNDARDLVYIEHTLRQFINIKGE